MLTLFSVPLAALANLTFRRGQFQEESRLVYCQYGRWRALWRWLGVGRNLNLILCFLFLFIFYINKWFNVLMTRFLHVESAQFGHERPARSPWRFLPCATCRYRLAQQCRQFALSFESLAWSNRFWSTVGFPVVLAIYITYFSPLFLESCESENSCCPRFILFTHESFWFRWFLVIKNPRLH